MIVIFSFLNGINKMFFKYFLILLLVKICFKIILKVRVMDRLSPLCKVESVWRTKPASLKPHPTTKLKWNTKNFISATHKVKSQSNYFVIVATRTTILRM